ncbi:MAG: triose-phosphate isomerase [Microgenomates group bacterium]
MKYVIGNWKSNKTSHEVAQWIQDFSLQKNENVRVVIAPATIHLTQFSSEKRDEIFLASQDVSHLPMGSYTGAVSARQLGDLGVKYALVGHSERRRYFAETHAQVADKIAHLVEEGITPVLCVDVEYVDAQADLISPEHYKKIIVAYEPLAAIGSGKSQDVGEVKSVLNSIRLIFGENTAVLYGGSVTEFNVREYALICDGVLVGGASLDAGHFSRIVKSVIA